MYIYYCSMGHISFINTLSAIHCRDIIFYSPTHGGFIPINCTSYGSVYLTDIDKKHIENIRLNCEWYKVNKINIIDTFIIEDYDCIIF